MASQPGLPRRSRGCHLVQLTVQAHDGVDLISKGRHERYVIDRARFAAKADVKGQQLT